MNLKLEILLLSEKLKWKNWPIWLKGIFLAWPSIGPLYLFIFRTPIPSGSAEVTTLLTNLEYQNYLIAVFIGFWSINMVILGLTWAVGGIVSETYRSYLKSNMTSKKISKELGLNEGSKGRNLRVLKKKYPMLIKKGRVQKTSGSIRAKKASSHASANSEPLD